MKYISSIYLLIFTFINLLPAVYAQSTEDSMVNHMRETQGILEKNVDQVISLIKNNNTAEALNLLEGIQIKVNHIDSLFDDFVWSLSNQGH